MMNHFFALLILLGMIFGLYAATRQAAELTPEQARMELWKGKRDAAQKQREDAFKEAAAQGRQPPSENSLPAIDDEARVIAMPDGTRVTPDSIALAPREMRRLRWGHLKNMGNSLTLTAVDAPKLAVELCIQYIGIMALWLGLMRVAEKAGLVAMLARALSPVMKRIFPGVPPDHPAMSTMIMNIAANMLGLDNAATPLGLKAMKDLQSLNPRKGTATNAMVMFLASNTSSVTLLPFGIVGWRAASGSINPSEFVVAALIATACSTVGAIVFTPLWARFWPMGAAAPEEENAGEEKKS